MLKKIKIEDWNFNFSDNEEILKSLVSQFHTLKNKNEIKSNPVRTVFTFDYEEKTYFVKYDVNNSFLKKIKHCIYPKAKSEFNSGKLLETKEIPVIKYLGYGINGNQGVIISEKEDAIQVDEYWFKNYNDKTKKKEFLAAFASFLNLFLNAEIMHPDFHLGNLLYSEEKKSIIVVDAFGIKSKKNIKWKAKIEMVAIIASLRNGMSNKEIYQLIIDSELRENLGEAKVLWTEILKKVGLWSRKYWEKRKKQIIENHYKWTSISTVNPNLIIRNIWFKIPIVNLDIKENDLEKEYIKKEFTPEVAEKIWLSSFCLQFHEINHRKPIAFNKEKGILYFEKIEFIKDILDYDAEREFLDKCKFAKLNIKSLETKIKESVNGGIYLDDITM